MRKTFLSLVLVGVIMCAGATARAGDAVSFPSLDKSIAEPVPATIVIPPGKGPFPAMVLLHGCNGRDITSNVSDWGAWLVRRGYIALTLRYLEPRHVPTACNGPPPSPEDVALDALGALT